MTQVKSKPDDNNMKDPPSGVISHKVFEHVTSREYGQVHRPWLFLYSVLSTNQPSENLSSSIISLFPYFTPCNNTNLYGFYCAGLLLLKVLPNFRRNLTISHPLNYFSALFVCLSFFSFRSFTCLIPFCFRPFSLSFLPPLSPIVCLLWRAVHILAFREPVSLTMNATRSMGRRQGGSGDRPPQTDSRRALS